MWIYRNVTCKSNKIDTLSIHGLGDGFSLQVVADDSVMVLGGGGTTGFPKWQGRSTGDKNQNPKTSIDQNLTRKKSNAEFPSHQKFPESIKN